VEGQGSTRVGDWKIAFYHELVGHSKDYETLCARSHPETHTKCEGASKREQTKLLGETLAQWSKKNVNNLHYVQTVLLYIYLTKYSLHLLFVL